MLIVLICISALIAALGIFNYVIAVLKSRGKTISSSVYSAATVGIFFVTSAVVLCLGVVLLRNPQAVFTEIHWGWILGFGIALSIFLFVIGIVWCIKGYQTYIGSTQMVLGVCVLAMMILGLCLAHTSTYSISTPKDLSLLNNLPNSQQPYQIEVVDDVDFEGVELESEYGNGNTYIINGKGHVFKNIECKITIDNSSHTFLRGQKSRILDLTVTDSEFHITPNYYYDKEHEGQECDFYLLSEDMYLDNVKIDVDIYAKEAEDNIRYETKSYISKIYPTSQTNENYSINVNIIREDKE